ncbi:MAG: hypothetical protein JWR75_1335 [Devosia sp.]|nr:hypothetical protein [Devosia sp.]
MGASSEETAIGHVGGRAFLIQPIVDFFGPDGIFVFEIRADGTVEQVETFGSDTNPEVGNPIDVATATVGGTTFAITANMFSSHPSLSVMTIDANGQLALIPQSQAVADVLDGDGVALDGIAIGVDVLTIGGDTFVVVNAPNLSNQSDTTVRLVVLRLDARGMLTPVSTSNFTDEWTAFDSSLAMVDGQPVYIGTNYDTDVVQTFLLGGGNDTLTGGAEDDLLLGYGGDDVMVGGPGADSFDGGAGNDLVTYEAATGRVYAGLAGNPLAERGEAVGDSFAGVENLGGSAFDDWLNGDSTANILQGMGGADLLVGGDGNDRLEGGDDDDKMVGSGGADSFDGGAGIDLVTYAFASGGVGAALDFTSPGGGWGEAAGDTHVRVEDLNGSNFGDWLRGDAGANTLQGLDGADTLFGGNGNDKLDGGAGNDQLAGGPGNDSYVVNAAGDAVSESAGQGLDTVFVQGSLGYILAVGAEIERLAALDAAAASSISSATTSARSSRGVLGPT